MKKTIAFLLILTLLSVSLSGCSHYDSNYTAVGFVHANEPRTAFMNFYTLKGRVVFRLKCQDASADLLRYSAKLETGSAVVYLDCGEGKTELCSVTSGDDIHSTFRPLQKGTVYIIVETDLDAPSENGEFRFDLESGGDVLQNDDNTMRYLDANPEYHLFPLAGADDDQMEKKTLSEEDNRALEDA